MILAVRVVEPRRAVGPGNGRRLGARVTTPGARGRGGSARRDECTRATAAVVLARRLGRVHPVQVVGTVFRELGDVVVERRLGGFERRLARDGLRASRGLARDGVDEDDGERGEEGHSEDDEHHRDAVLPSQPIRQPLHAAGLSVDARVVGERARRVRRGRDRDADPDRPHVRGDARRGAVGVEVGEDGNAGRDDRASERRPGAERRDRPRRSGVGARGDRPLELAAGHLERDAPEVHLAPPGRGRGR